jgi:uncharacterized sulfatase
LQRAARGARTAGVLLAALVLAWTGLGCRRAPPPGQALSGFTVYRFDDSFQAANVSAANVPSTARVTEPVVWKDFLTDRDVPWVLLRGRMGLRRGDLILQAQEGTPVIVSPKETPIDWGLYESVLVRMMAEGGGEIKLRIGDLELKQKLGPPGEYQVYRFDVNLEVPKGSRPLAIMPTDSLTALAAIDFIELVPRKTSFPASAGRLKTGKQDEYREALYVHSPSRLIYEVPVPKSGRLHFGLGVAEKGKPVTFRVAAQPDGRELHLRTLNDPQQWEDAEVDLSAYSGRTLKLSFQTSTDQPGAVGLWANPLLTTREPKSRPNVLVYLVCSLRPDHTSLHGYQRDTTPFLKKLGAASVVFDDAHAQAPWTKGSVPSLLTSLNAYTLHIIQDADTIPQGAVTMAQRLRSAGYVTASFLTNPFAGRVSGMDRGFDYVMEYPVIHRQRTEEADRGTDSAALNRVLLPWLERHRHEPFFVYAHVTDPHAPYRPPAEFEARFANPAETAQFDRDYARLRDQRQYGGGATVSRANCLAKGIHPDLFIRKAIDRYDAEIAHTDRSLELLADKLRQLGILDQTLIVVLSDHGEEFHEHGWTAHGHSLYQELVHALFLMWNPKLLPVPRRVTEPVQLLDLMPTVLELVGVRGDEIVQGQSLAPLARGLPFQRKGAVMASRFAHPSASPRGLVPEYRTGTFARIDADWKLIYRDEAGKAGLNRIELYDRRTDRKETKNVAPQHPDVVARLMADVTQWIEGQKQVRKLLGPGGKATLDPQTRERLRSLGYLGGKSGR